MQEQIKMDVARCPNTEAKAPLQPSQFPERPWKKRKTNLFESNMTYLLLMDFYFRYIEISRLTSATSYDVIIVHVISLTMEFLILWCLTMGFSTHQESSVGLQSGMDSYM